MSARRGLLLAALAVAAAMTAYGVAGSVIWGHPAATGHAGADL